MPQNTFSIKEGLYQDTIYLNEEVVVDVKLPVDCRLFPVLSIIIKDKSMIGETDVILGYA